MSHIGFWSLGIGVLWFQYHFGRINDCMTMNQQMDRGIQREVLYITRDLFRVGLVRLGCRGDASRSSDLHSTAASSMPHLMACANSLDIRFITSQSLGVQKQMQQSYGCGGPDGLGRRVQSPRSNPPFQLRPVWPFEMLDLLGRHLWWWEETLQFRR